MVTPNDTFGELSARLTRFVYRNRVAWEYYDGKVPVRNLGIAIPDGMQLLDAVVGWPEIVVDALAERLEWQGWQTPETGGEGLKRVERENMLSVEVSKAILDALVTGVGFLAVTAGADDEPQVIATAVPSTEATYVWDSRRKRVARGYVRSKDYDGYTIETLFLPNETVTRRATEFGRPVVTSVEHNRNVCGLIALSNRPRAGEYKGRSEITPALRYYTDHGVRTILGAEYNREIYTTPQRWMVNVLPEQLGIDESMSAKEREIVGWKVNQLRGLVLPPGDPDMPDPKVGQFTAASPAPYIDQLRMLAQLVSAQSGVPSSYLGFVSDNPASADAIRASESRLVKKAELRQQMFGQTLSRDLAAVCQSILDGGPARGDFIAGLGSQWREASTPTLAATMDAMVKARQAGFLPEGSEVALQRIGLSASEIEVVRREFVEQRARDRVASVVGLRQASRDPSGEGSAA